MTGSDTNRPSCALPNRPTAAVTPSYSGLSAILHSVPKMRDNAATERFPGTAWIGHMLDASQGFPY